MSYAPLHLKRLHACAPSRFMYLRDLHTLLTRLRRLNYAFHAPFLRALNSLNIPNFPKTMRLRTTLFKCWSINSHETFREGEMFYIHFKKDIKQ